MKCSTAKNSNKIDMKKPLRKGWTNLKNTHEIRLSDVKRMIIHIPNTGKTKQLLVNWK